MKYLGFLFSVSLLVFLGCPMDVKQDVKQKEVPILDGMVEIRGVMEAGQVVTADISRVGGEGAPSYQWYNEWLSDWKEIPGATSDSYTIKNTDVRTRLSVKVTRGAVAKSTEDGGFMGISHPVSNPNLQQITGKIAILNTSEVADLGTVLVADDTELGGGDENTKTRLTWYRSGVPIPESQYQDRHFYQLRAADAGHIITVSAWKVTNRGVVVSEGVQVAGTQVTKPVPPETTEPEKPAPNPDPDTNLPPSKPAPVPPAPQPPAAGSSSNPVFRTNLVDSTYMEYDAPQALVVNVNGGQLTYQWYETTDRTAVGKLISGKTSASFAPPTDKQGTFYYYVAVSNIDWWPENLNATTVRSATAKIDVVKRSGGGGIGSTATTPDEVEKRFRQYLSKADFEALFPRRLGSQGWRQFMQENHGHSAFPGDSWQNYDEYYSYDNLIAAIKEIAKWGYVLETRDMPGGHTNYNSRGYIVSKETGKTYPVFEEQGFNAEWNQNKAVVRTIVDYGSFISSAIVNDNKRELAAFLANVAHETGAGWAGAPGGEESWGLFFNEEVAVVTSGGYSDSYTSRESTEYPPVPGQSYHGRGSIQLSWNYNYGPFSILAFNGDKNVLLREPGKVAREGKLGWMSGLWFWMTPQLPKASCHDVMQSDWKPSGVFSSATSKGVVKGFGATINIINGGFEAGGRQKQRRINHYRDLAGKTGANIQGEKLDTVGMSPWT